jgi:hypothetical protein
MIAPTQLSDSEFRRRRLGASFGWLSGLLLLAAVVLVATHMGEGREVARLAREANPRWLLVVRGLERRGISRTAAVAATWMNRASRSSTRPSE